MKKQVENTLGITINSYELLSRKKFVTLINKAGDIKVEFDEEDLAMIKDEIPADYIASPKEAAQMVYHVAEAPGYMTGQIVTFSGGWY